MKASGKIIAALLASPVALTFGYWSAQHKPDKPRFYVDDDLEADVWEIPLIEPYRLITADGRSESQAGYSRWSFQNRGIAASFNPDSINYQQGFLTFHDVSQRKYGFCDLEHKTVAFLSNYQQFKDFAQAKALEKSLYNVESVYNCWHQTRQLPWAKEIFVQQCSSLPSN